MTQRIALIETDVAFSEELTKGLKEAGYQVSPINDVGQAVDILKADVPDLIYMAVELDGKPTGYVLCKRLKRLGAMKNVPLILAGEDPSGFEEHRSQKNHADAYLPKPFTAEQLVQAYAEAARNAAEGQDDSATTLQVPAAPAADLPTFDDLPMEPVEAEDDAANQAADAVLAEEAGQPVASAEAAADGTAYDGYAAAPEAYAQDQSAAVGYDDGAQGDFGNGNAAQAQGEDAAYASDGQAYGAEAVQEYEGQPLEAVPEAQPAYGADQAADPSSYYYGGDASMAAYDGQGYGPEASMGDGLQSQEDGDALAAAGMDGSQVQPAAYATDQQAYVEGAYDVADGYSVGQDGQAAPMDGAYGDAVMSPEAQGYAEGQVADAQGYAEGQVADAQASSYGTDPAYMDGQAYGEGQLAADPAEAAYAPEAGQDAYGAADAAASEGCAAYGQDAYGSGDVGAEAYAMDASGYGAASGDVQGYDGQQAYADVNAQGDAQGYSGDQGYEYQAADAGAYGADGSADAYPMDAQGDGAASPAAADASAIAAEGQCFAEPEAVPAAPQPAEPADEEDDGATEVSGEDVHAYGPAEIIYFPEGEDEDPHRAEEAEEAEEILEAEAVDESEASDVAVADVVPEAPAVPESDAGAPVESTDPAVLAAQVRALRSEMEAMRIDSDATFQELKAARVDACTARADLAMVQADLNEAKEALAACKARLEEQAAEQPAEAAPATDDAAKAEIDALKAELDKAREESGKDRAALEELSAQVEALKAQLEAAASKAADAPAGDGSTDSSDAEALKAELEKAREEAKAATELAEEASKENAALNAQLAELKEAAAKAEGAPEGDAATSAAEEKAKAAKEEAARLQDELAHAREELEQARGAAASLAQSEEKAAALEAEKVDLEQQFAISEERAARTFRKLQRAEALRAKAQKAMDIALALLCEMSKGEEGAEEPPSADGQ